MNDADTIRILQTKLVSAERALAETHACKLALEEIDMLSMTILCGSEFASQAAMAELSVVLLERIRGKAQAMTVPSDDA